jgi:hypothetical protein
MRRFSLLVVLALCLPLISGCQGKTAGNTDAAQAGINTAAVTTTQPGNENSVNKGDNDKSNALAADNKSYLGDWSLKVSADEELYLMTGLAKYFGATGIYINEINKNHMKGSIYSVSGAPSFRQANVDFEGDVAEGKMTASYKDDGWLYSGTVELRFKDNAIDANITRDKSDATPMWGIPEGSFTFLRPIETETVDMAQAERLQLNKFLSAATKDTIAPFEEGGLTDESMINFVGLNLGLGTIDISEFGDKIKSGADIVFDESVMNTLSMRYFGTPIKEHKATDHVKYEKGNYIIPALGGITEYPAVQMLMKDTTRDGIFYAIVDYMHETPQEGIRLNDQDLIKLKKEDGGYMIRAIKEIESPIDFKLWNSIE